MMKKVMLAMVFLLVAWSGWVHADGYEAEFSVGSDSFFGGFHTKRGMDQGFWKAGGGVLYNDDDDLEYKWMELDFTVGSESFSPGLTCEVGFKGILGDAEVPFREGDVGAMAFAGRIGYLFPKYNMPIPLELFAGIAYAPEITSFRDTDNYLAFNVGVGIRVVQNASIVAQYHSYEIDMTSGAREWQVDDDMIRLGLVMRF